MKRFKTTISALVLGSALLLPTVVGAAPEDDVATEIVEAQNVASSIPQTIINGIEVAGDYIVHLTARVAYIPDGVGMVVVDQSIPLPFGAYYVD